MCLNPRSTSRHFGDQKANSERATDVDKLLISGAFWYFTPLIHAHCQPLSAARVNALRTILRQRSEKDLGEDDIHMSIINYN
jgi:hypothetical protein